MTPVPFNVHKEQTQSGVDVVAVRGELDMNTAPQLERVLDEFDDGPQAMAVLDLCDCEFIDSTGIALIVRTWQRLDREGDGDGQLVLCSHNHQVRRLLEITGVESSIPIYERRDAALDALRD